MRRANSNRSIRSERGQAAVEFAIVAPVVFMLLFAIIQFGITFDHYLAVTDAARAAERQAIVARVANLTIDDVKQTAAAAAGGLDASQLNVTVDDQSDPTLSNAGSTLTVTVTYPYSVNVLGFVVNSGNLTSQITGQLE